LERGAEVEKIEATGAVEHARAPNPVAARSIETPPALVSPAASLA
jgi:hypothetical protein